jgi:betaine-aldehyde dehydrogenase
MQASTPTALNWIGGAWVGADTVHDSINPATYEVIGGYVDGGEDAAIASIAAAKRAFFEIHRSGRRFGGRGHHL